MIETTGYVESAAIAAGFTNLSTPDETVTIGAVSTWSDLQSVPEPTSGLLLLLGVAGLALKRTCA